ncbi:hypothetical protein MKQ68_08055 [Chitinophaga horti]|uniref:MG2 domain-containing protein n=1 Tax=Chitinophaga horti TaxID=2920382 RepID=A0ABY6J5U5_9BACT|nr:hypothetical protein [Chitinophaga horti]UYQ95046.1 hypothetical protein MKQ68_08055 [Chitinophaga horti]
MIKKLIYLLAIAVLPLQLSAQSVLQSSLDEYRRKVFQEKIYVHTDKEFYLAGEIMWFKVYNVDASWHRLADISKVAYVDVLDPQGRPVMQAKVELKDGIGSGSVYVPVVVNTGTYKLRGYTAWMKNFDASGYYEKTVTFVNSQKILDEPATTGARLQAHFYPEGGYLVKDLQSKVGFTIRDARGNVIAATGAVLDQFNDTVVTFKPGKYGAGNFLFTPRENRVYHAVIQAPGVAAERAALPEVRAAGYVMSLRTEGNNIHVSVNAANAPGDGVYLLAHTRQVVKVGESKSLQAGKAEFIIDRNKLGDGVTHFTVFNMDRQPLCERLYFKRPATFDISATADKPQYGIRQPVNLTLNARDAASMSMAVYRLDSLQQLSGDDITTALYLTADIGGYVPNASAYLNDEAAMDDLLLTRGWRRFRWSDVTGPAKPAFQYAPEFNGHLITGKVIDSRNGRPTANIATFLSIPGPTVEFYTSLSDKQGSVRFDVRDFYGPNEVIAQTDGQKDSMYRIELNSPFSDSIVPGTWPQTVLTDQYAQTLTRRSINMQVQNIFTGELMKRVNLPLIDTSAFYGKPDARYMLDDYTRFVTMEEVLREYVLGINVRRRNGKFVLYALDMPTRNFFSGNPLVLLDGVPMFDMDKVLAYDPLKVRKMEVLTKRYFLGNLYFDGVVSMTTYKGDINGYELDANATVLDYEGLQVQRQFYGPDYSTDELRASHLPDYRNQLAWRPEVEKESTQTFYTSDLPGRYVVVLQALGENGATGSKTLYFDVKE